MLPKRLVIYFDEHNLLTQTQFGFRKGLATCDALLTLAQDLQAWLILGMEFRLISLDFSSAVQMINNKALLFKLKSGDVSAFFNDLKEFLSNKSQKVVVMVLYVIIEKLM